MRKRRSCSSGEKGEIDEGYGVEFVLDARSLGVRGWQWIDCVASD